MVLDAVQNISLVKQIVIKDVKDYENGNENFWNRVISQMKANLIFLGQMGSMAKDKYRVENEKHVNYHKTQ